MSETGPGREYSNFTVRDGARVINGDTNDSRQHIETTFNSVGNRYDQCQFSQNTYNDRTSNGSSLTRALWTAAGIFGVLIGILLQSERTAGTSGHESSPPTIANSLREPAEEPSDTQHRLYVQAARRLPSVEREIESWDTNGARSRYPELRREPFTQKIVATYVQHFHAAGLEQAPHVLVVNDNIVMKDKHFVDAIDSSGTLRNGPSGARFAHHKMANWMGSANHYGFDVYIFRSGHFVHDGAPDGGKGYGNWRFHAHSPRLDSRQPTGHRARGGSQQELVTFLAPF